MLGKETDLFLIDTWDGSIYNFGYTSRAGEKMHRLIDKKAPRATADARAKRFIIISGIELGVDKEIKKRTFISVYNPKVKKMSKYTCN